MAYGRRYSRRRYGRRGTRRGGRRPLPKAVWKRLARKVGPGRASALARRNPRKARRLASGSRRRRSSRRRGY